MVNILTAGISYKKTPVELRERLGFDSKDPEKSLTELIKYKSVEECLLVSTCNRIEFYAVCENEEECLNDIKNFISETHNISKEELSSHMYTYFGSETVRHLFRVASSLDSMVVGEPQILGQVKEAYKSAHKSGTTSLILNRLFHSAFSTAKRVRSETGIGALAVSISYAAVELAKRIFEDFHKRSAILIGSGEMGELAAKNLINAGISELIITSRNYNNAEILARKLNGRAVKMEEVYYRLNHADIVITATDSVEFIIKPAHLKESLKIRKNEPIFLIDIAVPRNVDPRVEEIENVYLYDIDDLKEISEENIKSRRDRAKRAEEIVNERVQSFNDWLEHLKVVPTIIELKNRFELIKNNELKKALRKIESSEYSKEQVLDNLASNIISKLLHNPVTKLKKEPTSSLSALYVETIRKLFNLETNLSLVEDETDEQIDKNWNKRK